MKNVHMMGFEVSDFFFQKYPYKLYAFNYRFEKYEKHKFYCMLIECRHEILFTNILLNVYESFVK